MRAFYAVSTVQLLMLLPGGRAGAQPPPGPSNALSVITETALLYRLGGWGPASGNGHVELHLGLRRQARSGGQVGASVYIGSGELESFGLNVRYRWNERDNGTRLEVGPRIGLYKSNGQYRVPVIGVGGALDLPRDAGLVATFIVAREARAELGRSRTGANLHLGGRVGGRTGGLLALGVGIVFGFIGIATAGT